MSRHEHQLARILIVDDHVIVRHGIAMVIDREPGLHACCEAADLEQALKANRACPHDLAIIDLSLSDSSGLDLAKMLAKEFPKLRMLMLSMHDEAAYAQAALQAGAHGYLMKQDASGKLPQAIRKILDGGLYLSDSVQAQILIHTVSRHTSLSGIHAPPSNTQESGDLITLGMRDNQPRPQFSTLQTVHPIYNTQ